MKQEDPIIEELAPELTRARTEDLPPQIMAINQRHVDALYKLISTMRAAGIDEDMVRSSVRDVVSSYEQELVDALTRISDREA